MDSYTEFDEIMMESDRLIKEGEDIYASCDVMSHELDSIEDAIQKLAQDIENVRLERPSENRNICTSTTRTASPVSVLPRADP